MRLNFIFNIKKITIHFPFVTYGHLAQINYFQYNVEKNPCSSSLKDGLQFASSHIQQLKTRQ